MKTSRQPRPAKRQVDRPNERAGAASRRSLKPFEMEGNGAIVHEEQLRQLIRHQIELLGEDPDRDGLKRTPKRVAEALKFFTRGYHQDPKAVLNNALFDATSDEMVIVKDIDFYSLCEHHMLPFFGKCHIAYLPTRKVVGLSKLPRLVEVYARRLQIQERMTQQIASGLQDLIGAQGVGVVVEAQHLCMMMRGVEKQNSYAITSTLLGRFRDDARTRAEFINLIQHRRTGA